MVGLLIIIVFAVAIILIGLWVRHRERTVDDYFEREYQDPPVGMPPTW